MVLSTNNLCYSSVKHNYTCFQVNGWKVVVGVMQWFRQRSLLLEEQTPFNIALTSKALGMPMSLHWPAYTLCKIRHTHHTEIILQKKKIQTCWNNGLPNRKRQFHNSCSSPLWWKWNRLFFSLSGHCIKKNFVLFFKHCRKCCLGSLSWISLIMLVVFQFMSEICSS